MRRNLTEHWRWVSVASLLIGTAVLSQCSTPASPPASSEHNASYFIAFDTSESARPKLPKFLKDAGNFLTSVDPDTKVILFRFDSKPAEFYSGTAFAGPEDAARVLKPLLEHTSIEKGTNLSKLLIKIDSLLPNLGPNVHVIVYTDAGTELMSNDDIRGCKDVAKKWGDSNQVKKVKFIGVRPGYREEIRRCMPNSKIVIENLDG